MAPRGLADAGRRVILRWFGRHPLDRVQHVISSASWVTLPCGDVGQTFQSLCTLGRDREDTSQQGFGLLQPSLDVVLVGRGKRGAGLSTHAGE